jgi:hypothetical protein
MAMCREVITQLETAQEGRESSKGEVGMIKRLKHKILGLAAIEKSIARQKSKITWLRKGDANTKFFQLMANNEKQKKLYPCLASK